jgi:hypothetical protein
MVWCGEFCGTAYAVEQHMLWNSICCGTRRILLKRFVTHGVVWGVLWNSMCCGTRRILLKRIVTYGVVWGVLWNSICCGTAYAVKQEGFF